jgi:hypothetical protein
MTDDSVHLRGVHRLLILSLFFHDIILAIVELFRGSRHRFFYTSVLEYLVVPRPMKGMRSHGHWSASFCDSNICGG